VDHTTQKYGEEANAFLGQFSHKFPTMTTFHRHFLRTTKSLNLSNQHFQLSFLHQQQHVFQPTGSMLLGAASQLRHYSRPNRPMHQNQLKQVPDIYSLKSIIDPRLPGINDKAVSSIFTPLVVRAQRFAELMKLRKDLGFFETEGKSSHIKMLLLQNYQDLYECKNIQRARPMCTPSGFGKLRQNINQILKTKKAFPLDGQYKLLDIVHVARAHISNVNATFVQITSRIKLPNGEVEYVVFERDMTSGTASWKFAGWVHPDKIYRKPSMTELVGVGK